MAQDRAADTGWRSLWGLMLLVMVLFTALSLFSYDWTDISLLKAHDVQTPRNLIGPVGAWMGFGLISLLGVGAYLVPVWFLLAGLVLMFDKAVRVWPRILWCSLMLLSLAMIQELYDAYWADMRERLNIETFTAGIIGWGLMKNLFIRWLSPVGAGLLVWALFVMSAVMFAGPATIVKVSRWSWQKLLTAVNRTRNLSAAAGKPEKQRLIEEEEKKLERERKRLEKMIRRQEKDRAEKPSVPDWQPAEPARRAVIETPKAEPVPVVSPPAPARVTVPPAERESRRKPREQPVPPAAAEAAQSPARSPSLPGYQLPPVSLLNPVPPTRDRGMTADSATTAQVILATLQEFGIEAQVTNVEKGPVVTRYELLPAPGVRVEKIAGLSNNLALSLKATSVRVQAPVPGKGVVGVEVPNSIANMVVLRQVMEGDQWNSHKARLPLALGKDVGGNDIVADLTDMPHLLVAGATGSGKTVCMNSILVGLLMGKTPEELRMLLVDPKIVEFSGYNHLPHLIAPVITNPKKVALGLRWAINEMERRYKLFARAGVRNIEGYNNRIIAKQESLFGDTGEEEQKNEMPERVPYIVIVVDELADLMLVDQSEIENSIARLAQLSRAVGIHMIISTQRPSVNVITGTIKANFPARIAFQVAQKVDSRTILDTAGADKLLGRGDMLFLPPGTSKLIRAQGAMCTDDEIRKVVDFIKQQAQPLYETEIAEKLEKAGARADSGGGENEEDEELLSQSIEVIKETRRASTSSLQRRLRIGYTRAARIMDVLEQRGIVGPPRGSDPREILIDLEGEIPDNSPVSESEEVVEVETGEERGE